MALKPTHVTVEGNFKTFGLDRGRSDGTSVSITFEIPPGMDGKELRANILAEKERIDLLCITSEYLKGSLQQADFLSMKAQIKSAYDKLLGLEAGGKQKLEPKAAETVSEKVGSGGTNPVHLNMTNPVEGEHFDETPASTGDLDL